MSKIKRIAAVASAAALLGTGAAYAAAPARATESQYLADLAWHGIYSPGGATTLLSWGYRVCVDQDRGFSMAYSANNIWMQNTIDYNGAMQVVTSAKLFLC